MNSVAQKNHSYEAILLIAALIVAVVAGASLGVGAYVIAAPLAMILPTAFLLLRPDLSLIAYSGLTLLVAGTLKYFFGFGQFQWALSGLGLVLLGYSIVVALFAKSKVRATAGGLSHLIFLWLVGLLFSSAANATAGLDWMVGLRIYLPVLGVFTYLAYCKPQPSLTKGLILFMLAISSIQWAVSLYQKLVIVPQRISGRYPGSSWDSVVGTFGGDKFGGGESGSLGIYMSVMMVVAASLVKYRQLSNWSFVLIFVSGFAAMALVESKVIALMIPLGCFFVYRDYVLKNPAKFFAGTIGIVALMLGLLVAYYYLYWQPIGQQDIFSAIAERLSYSFDPNFQATATSLGRIKSLVFWSQNHSLLNDPLTFLFGHGLASAVSTSSLIGEGAAVQRYGFVLDVTGASKLLWESGVFGLSVFLSLFVLGFVRARQLASLVLLPAWHRAAMRGVEAAMVLMPLSIFYEVTVVSSPPMQFVAMFMLGYIAYWWRETSGGKRG
jgi:hypothetical protein